VTLKLSSKESYNFKNPKKLVFILVTNPNREVELLNENKLDIAQSSSDVISNTENKFTEVKFEYLQAMVLMLNLKSSVFKAEKKRCDFISSFYSALSETKYRWSPLALGLPLSWNLYSAPKKTESINPYPITLKVLYSNTLGLLTTEGNNKLSESLRKKNYNVKFESRSFIEMKAEMESGESQAALVGFVPDYLDPDALLAPIIGTGEQFNFSSFSDKTADDLMDQSRISLDRTARLSIYRKLFALISDECPVTYLGTLKTSYLVSKKWNLPGLSSLGFQTLKFADVNKTETKLGKL
jgi:hypothetical protein